MEAATNTLPVWSEWIKWGADLALFFATLALAVYTARLFRETKNTAVATGLLVAEQIQDREIAQKHHRESLIPVVTYVASAWYIKPQDRPGPELFTDAQILFTGHLQNAGTGPALNCKLEITPLGFATMPYELGTLKDGFSHFGREMFMNVHHDSKFQRPTFLPFIAKITYTDVFDQGATTLHVNIGDDWYVTTTTFQAPVFKSVKA